MKHQTYVISFHVEDRALLVDYEISGGTKEAARWNAEEMATRDGFWLDDTYFPPHSIRSATVSVKKGQ